MVNFLLTIVFFPQRHQKGPGNLNLNPFGSDGKLGNDGADGAAADSAGAAAVSFFLNAGLTIFSLGGGAGGSSTKRFFTFISFGRFSAGFPASARSSASSSGETALFAAFA